MYVHTHYIHTYIYIYIHTFIYIYIHIKPLQINTKSPQTNKQTNTKPPQRDINYITKLTKKQLQVERSLRRDTKQAAWTSEKEFIFGS